MYFLEKTNYPSMYEMQVHLLLAHNIPFLVYKFNEFLSEGSQGCFLFMCNFVDLLVEFDSWCTNSINDFESEEFYEFVCEGSPKGASCLRATWNLIFDF